VTPFLPFLSGFQGQPWSIQDQGCSSHTYIPIGDINGKRSAQRRPGEICAIRSGLDQVLADLNRAPLLTAAKCL